MNSSAREREPHTSEVRVLLAYIALCYLELVAGLLESFLSGPLLVLRFPVTLALLWSRPHLFPRGALGLALVGQLIGWTSGGWLWGLPLVCTSVAELWVLRRVLDELASASVCAAE